VIFAAVEQGAVRYRLETIAQVASDAVDRLHCPLNPAARRGFVRMQILVGRPRRRPAPRSPRATGSCPLSRTTYKADKSSNEIGANARS
jgi:hypothetical protein